jgi:hypothetical protein
MDFDFEGPLDKCPRLIKMNASIQFDKWDVKHLYWGYWTGWYGLDCSGSGHGTSVGFFVAWKLTFGCRKLLGNS